MSMGSPDSDNFQSHSIFSCLYITVLLSLSCQSYLLISLLIFPSRSNLLHPSSFSSLSTELWNSAIQKCSKIRSFEQPYDGKFHDWPHRKDCKQNTGTLKRLYMGPGRWLLHTHKGHSLNSPSPRKGRHGSVHLHNSSTPIWYGRKN